MTDMKDDPIYKKMIDAIEQAKEHNIKPISVSIGPFGIPIIESDDVPKDTITLMEPKRYKLDTVSQQWDEEGKFIRLKVARPKPKQD